MTHCHLVGDSFAGRRRVGGWVSRPKRTPRAWPTALEEVPTAPPARLVWRFERRRSPAPPLGRRKPPGSPHANPSDRHLLPFSAFSTSYTLPTPPIGRTVPQHILSRSRALDSPIDPWSALSVQRGRRQAGPILRNRKVVGGRRLLIGRNTTSRLWRAFVESAAGPKRQARFCLRLSRRGHPLHFGHTSSPAEFRDAHLQ